jgi:hypothetical protein
VMIIVTCGCAGARFPQKMDAPRGEDISVLVEAWGPPPQTIRCREAPQNWDREHKELIRQVCEWEQQGMSTFMWTLVRSSYDNRQSTPEEQRLTLPCSVIVVVAKDRVHAWQVAPNQQCQDARAVEAVPLPRSQSGRAGGS